jgi:hypothetical protein
MVVIGSGGYKQVVGRRFVRLFVFVLASAFACGLLAVSAQAAKPTIEEVSAKSITSKRATLEATVNPGGLETTYEFWVEFAVCQNPPLHSGVCDSIAIGTHGQGQLAAGSAAQNVDTTLTQLSPGYLYRYWVVANNSAGEETSASKTLTALPAPVVDSESASSIATSDATLEAQINPEGQAVYYQFQLVSSASEFPSELECPPHSFLMGCLQPAEGVLPVQYLASATTDENVSVDLAKSGVTLKPDTIYHYRVLVAPHVQTEDTVQWDGPPVVGADETFTTLEEPAAPTKKGTGSTGGGSSSGSGSQPPGTGPYQPPIYYEPLGIGQGHKGAGKGHHKSKHPAAHKKHQRHKSKAPKHERHNTRKG